MTTQLPTALAMVLVGPRTALRRQERAVPEPGPGQVLLKVRACGICRTDLNIVDGGLTEPNLPLARAIRSSAKSWRSVPA